MIHAPVKLPVGFGASRTGAFCGFRIRPCSYLCVDDSCHPESLGGSGHRQHGPEENQNG